MHKFLFIACLIFGGCQPASPPAPVPEPMGSVQVRTDISHIAYIRPSRTKLNAKVANYLVDELRKAGFQVSLQSFRQGTNIIGVRPGVTARTIITGSHYDSVFVSRGADDNASGCAVNLAVARALAKQRLRHTLTVIFFDAEEIGLVGSTYYANHPREACDLMVNFDMVGHLRATVPLDTVLPPLFKKYPWAKAITFQTADATDHIPFQRKGIPAVWLFTGMHEFYHQPNDVPSTLNYEGIVKISRYATDLVLSFDKHVDTAFINSLAPIPYRP